MVERSRLRWLGCPATNCSAESRSEDQVSSCLPHSQSRCKFSPDLSPIASRSPWQNEHVERLIGSIRRECLDHMIVFGEAHLRRILGKYAVYYNESRIHRALTRMRRSIGRLSASASLHRSLFLADFITNIAKSRFRCTQWLLAKSVSAPEFLRNRKG